MGDDERRGHDLEAEDALGCGLLDARSCQSAQAASLQIVGDPAQHLGEVCPGAAAGIEHVDVLRRQPVGDAEIVLERPVHAGDHVAHHLGRRVPDAELLAQLGVERFKEWLVEILYRLTLAESCRRRRPAPRGPAPPPSSPALRRGAGAVIDWGTIPAGIRPAVRGREDARRPHAS